MSEMNRKDFLKGMVGAAAMAAMGVPALVLGEDSAEVSELDKLIAKDAIREQINNYCLCMDRLDRELGYNLFTKECRYEFERTFSGTGYEFVDKCLDEWHPYMINTAHRMLNIKIAVDSATTARSHTYGLMHSLTKDAEGKYTMSYNEVRYCDKWVKQEDGVRRICDRQGVVDWYCNIPVDAWAEPELSTRIDKKDPFYTLFPEFI